MKTNGRTIWAAMAAAGAIAACAVAEDGAKIVVEGSTTVGPVAKAFAEYYMARHQGVNITVSESGSGNGAKAVINGACDVATMSRPMKENEVAAMKAAGGEPTEHIVAMDGLAVAVHMSNPLRNLTVEQVHDIYVGKIRNWKDVGGPDLPIVVISRDTNSGTYECFENMVMNKEKMFDRVEYVGSNGAVRQRLLDTPAAIGYLGLAFLEGVKPLTINGIEATPETVRAKTYPIARPLYMYTNGAPKAGSHLAQFIGLAHTADGRRIVDDTGYVSVK